MGISVDECAWQALYICDWSAGQTFKENPEGVASSQPRASDQRERHPGFAEGFYVEVGKEKKPFLALRTTLQEM